MIEGLFQPVHLIIIMAIVLIVFGPGKLPSIGGALGKSIKEFKESTAELHGGATTAVSGAENRSESSVKTERVQTVPGSDSSHV